MKEQVFEQFPFVDVAFGPGQIDKLGEFLQSDDLAAQGYFEFEGFPGDLPMKRERPFQAWVQISVGCNCVCSYCIVPSTRGRERSRRPAELVARGRSARRRRRQGGDAARPERQLLRPRPAEGRADRLRRRCSRWSTASTGSSGSATRARTPRTCARSVIAAHAELPSLCEHIHLPLQSGSSRILKAMRRTYDRDRYMQRVEMIREHVPDCAITTDIIVGFPGETEDDFRETLEVVEEVGYDSAFTFIFSPRRGTEAADLPDQVPHAGQARAHGAARRARPAARAGAQPPLRRHRPGGAGRGPEPHRPRAAARAHAPQQDGQLRRAWRSPGELVEVRDHGRDVDDAGGRGVAARARRLMTA